MQHCPSTHHLPGIVSDSIHSFVPWGLVSSFHKRWDWDVNSVTTVITQEVSSIAVPFQYAHTPGFTYREKEEVRGTQSWPEDEQIQRKEDPIQGDDEYFWKVPLGRERRQNMRQEQMNGTVNRLLSPIK